MNNDKERMHISINDLIMIFRRSLIALIPVMDEARIPWREPDAYDDWDDISNNLFDVIVRRSIDYSNLAKSKPLIGYDKRFQNIIQYSFIGAKIDDVSYVFESFSTLKSNMDNYRLAEIDSSFNIVSYKICHYNQVNLILFLQDDVQTRIIRDIYIDI